MYKSQHPLTTILILICFFAHGALANANWGLDNNWQRPLLAIGSMFLAVGLGIWAGMEKEDYKK